MNWELDHHGLLTATLRGLMGLYNMQSKVEPTDAPKEFVKTMIYKGRMVPVVHRSFKTSLDAGTNL